MKTVLKLSVGVALLISLAYASTNPQNASSTPTVLIEPNPLPTQLDLATKLDPELIRETDQFDTFTIGTTWNDQQHSGTVGRMVVRDSLGYMHFVWMNVLNSGGTNRHIYYNYISSTGMQGWPGVGTQVDAVYRAGYTVLDVGYGRRAFPCFHQVETQGSLYTWTTIAGDVQPHFGAFLSNPAPPLPGVDQMLYPTMQLGRNGVFHIVATAVPAMGYDLKHFYMSGIYNLTTFQVEYNLSWTFVDSVMTASADVGTSWISNKAAFAWIRNTGDIYYLIDEDGSDPDFTQAINLTNFTTQDTFRTHNDLSVFIDQNDHTHIAFTTKGYQAGPPPSIYPNASLIWHWSDQYPNDFRVIAQAFDPSDTVECGPGDLKACKPSLGQSSTTGYLYCVYQYYDTRPEHLSALMMPSGEVYVSVSTEGGMNWAYPYNCTQTVTPFHAPAGACMSEVTPSLAKWVTDNCHLMFIQDKNAGYGGGTLNPVKYLREPVTWIPTQPVIPQNIPLHVETPAYPVQVSAAPIGIPQVGQGGSFDFTVSVHNITNQPQTTDAWAMVKLPDSTLYGPVLGPIINLTLPPNAFLSRLRTQYVPVSAPIGQYYYIAYVGDYNPPNNIVGDSASFPFTVTPMAGGNIQTWQGTGEDFNDLSNTGTHYPAPLLSKPLQVSISPNPFNPIAVASFELRVPSYVKWEVYDTQGRRVGIQYFESLQIGTHQIKFDGSGLPSGVYLYQLQISGQQAVGKMVLMK